MAGTGLARSCTRPTKACQQRASLQLCPARSRTARSRLVCGSSLCIHKPHHHLQPLLFTPGPFSSSPPQHHHHWHHHQPLRLLNARSRVPPAPFSLFLAVQARKEGPALGRPLQLGPHQREGLGQVARCGGLGLDDQLLVGRAVGPQLQVTRRGRRAAGVGVWCGVCHGGSDQRVAGLRAWAAAHPRPARPWQPAWRVARMAHM